MDRFRDEGMPMSVAVVDTDWHLMDVPEEFGTAWTGYTSVSTPSLESLNPSNGADTILQMEREAIP